MSDKHINRILLLSEKKTFLQYHAITEKSDFSVLATLVLFNNVCGKPSREKNSQVKNLLSDPTKT